MFAPRRLDESALAVGCGVACLPQWECDRFFSIATQVSSNYIIPSVFSAAIATLYDLWR
ncbi:hypothetical protein H6G20_02540 [Desertifilum sp. FACHB-1129]|uniref:hypothetical protein n=1 Tax=unclassified Desertifilum TaxID=2621682 RepID=UPI0013013A18|nr:hypothetical protein [Desertifilum tharense]MBD2310554.1 hypothetical protein [Desertifilum sp. FACHB-1129]MBD2322006.1 hypothetical protein [Desertifilum sp. FACHB-866]MBD2332133.1 hypothetical protein [Desertifilum sp. FACHB-868]MCD8487194.1 hypothetical protein [Desertifilum sp.]MDI9634933.1 hypothetical protein [Geitlerinema splendidum]